MSGTSRLLAVLAASVFVAFPNANAPAAEPSRGSCATGTPFVPSAIFMTDAHGRPQGLSTADVVKLFAGVGVKITWDPPASQVMIIDDREVYGGNAVLVDPLVRAVGFHNLIVQNSGDPVRYTLTFDKAVASVTFRRARMVAGPNGVTHPRWTATASDADGAVVSKVSEAEIRSFVFVPARAFELAGSGRIKTIVFDGDDRNFDGFANLVVDDLNWCR